MEKVARAQAYGKSENAKAARAQKKLFEINPHHPIIKEMLERVKDNPDDQDTIEMSQVLYETALINSGYVLANPADYTRKFWRIFNGALGIPKNSPIEEIEVDLDDEEEEFDEENLDEDEEFDGISLLFMLILKSLILIKMKMRQLMTLLKRNQKLKRKSLQSKKKQKQMMMKPKQIFD